MLLRYLNVEFILKTPIDCDAKKLLQLTKSYPFILFQKTTENEILICNQSSCYQNASNIDDAVEKFFEILKNNAIL